MRIVTWNIELGRNLERAARELSEQPELASADIILLQEMDPVGTQWLADELGMTSRYTAAANHPDTGLPFGNAVLSRWPMGEATELALPHTARWQGQPRAATITDVTVDGNVVNVCSLHLETILLPLRRRIEQVEVVRAHIAERPASRTIVAGDFNTASRYSVQRTDRTLSPIGLHPISPRNQPTFHRFSRPFVLDHVYARGFQPIGAGVVTEAKASDHRPVWAEVV